MKIKNYKKIATNSLRKQALDIVEAGLKAIDTKQVIRDNISIKGKRLKVGLRSYSLKKIKRIYLVGIGKCSYDAAVALEKILKNRLEAGIIFDVRCEKDLNVVKCYKGDHPLPTKRNVNATKKIIEMLKGLKREDLVITVVSGGGSTLLCQPENTTCFEESSLVQCFMKVGAKIEDLNTVRKHLSLARGGYLAKYAYPARVISLIFSDVPGDKKQFIASGPTIKDETTINDAKKIFKKYKIEKVCGFKPMGLMETPKEDKYFKRVTNRLLVSNKTALMAMAKKAIKMGFLARICNDCFSGEAKTFGTSIVKDLKKLKLRKALFYGGEATVDISGGGKGGRNQEVVLSALKKIEKDEIVIAFASDGIDNTNHAGAIGDIKTVEKAMAKKMDLNKYLKNNDSYNFFKKTGDYLKTGYTGSNVSDLIIAIKK